MVPKKENKLFLTLDCLNVLIRCLTLETDPLTRVGVTLYNSSLVLICDAKTWSPQKRGKTVSDTGLSLCADQVFDFVQEMGDLKLTH